MIIPNAALMALASTLARLEPHVPAPDISMDSIVLGDAPHLNACWPHANVRMVWDSGGNWVPGRAPLGIIQQLNDHYRPKPIKAHVWLSDNAVTTLRRSDPAWEVFNVYRRPGVMTKRFKLVEDNES